MAIAPKSGTHSEIGARFLEKFVSPVIKCRRGNLDRRFPFLASTFRERQCFAKFEGSPPGERLDENTGLNNFLVGICN